MSSKRKQRRWDYEDQRAAVETINREIRVFELGELIRNADLKSDPTALLALLRSDEPLSLLEQHRGMLATVLDHRWRRDVGPILEPQTVEVERLIIARCKRRLHRIRQQRPRRPDGKLIRPGKGTIPKVAEEMWIVALDDGEMAGIDPNLYGLMFRNILSALDRGKKKPTAQPRNRPKVRG